MKYNKLKKKLTLKNEEFDAFYNLVGYSSRTSMLKLGLTDAEAKILEEIFSEIYDEDKHGIE